MARFFVSCAIGFENELLSELNEIWFQMMDLDGQPTRSTLEKCDIVPGGIEIDCAEHLGFQINFFSKLAHRVLLRIASFEARYFDQYEKELKKIDLSKWLNHFFLEVKIESHKSRLNNQKNLEEAFCKVFSEKKFIFKSDSKHKSPQTVYIRLFKDRVTISLDTSGEHLHRRGYAKYRGEAPLRETLAALMWKIAQQQLELYFKDFVLIDPFMGSGTVLFEVLGYQLPLFDRDFSWMQFKNRPKIFQSETWKKNYKWIKPNENLIQVFGFDIDAKSIENTEKNFELFKQSYHIDKSIPFVVKKADSLSADLSVLKTLNNLVLITNPPYGHRLSEGDAIKVLQRFESELDLRALVVLHPESWKFEFKKIKQVLKIDFKNQGLKLNLSVFSN